MTNIIIEIVFERFYVVTCDFLLTMVYVYFVFYQKNSQNETPNHHTKCCNDHDDNSLLNDIDHISSEIETIKK